MIDWRELWRTNKVGEVLKTCSECQRHQRVTDTTTKCIWCGAKLYDATTEAPPPKPEPVDE